MFISYYAVVRSLYFTHRSEFLLCICLALALVIISYWLLFRKAGVPAWHALIPFWNEYQLFELAWGDGYFFIFELIPYCGFIFRWIMLYKLCRAFGKDDKKWIVGMILLPTVARLILAAGEAAYIGPEGNRPEQNPYRFEKANRCR